MSFADNLKKIRKENNLSQEQLADELGVSRQAISKWESSVAYPEMDKIIMICNVLYNRTDMTVLPIDDGFYDLLLEKYKIYDSNFQVGSAVVEFRNFIENDLDNPTDGFLAGYKLMYLDEVYQSTIKKVKQNA